MSDTSYIFRLYKDMYFICFTWNIAYFEANIEIYYIYFKDNYIYTVNNKDDVDNVVEYMRHREAY